MGTQTVQGMGVTKTRTGSEFGRLILTLAGGAALVVGAFLNWTRGLTGDTLSNRALIRVEFATQPDAVRTLGGIAVVLGLVAMLGLVDRSGWLTRLAGLLGIALFVLFTIEVYRSSQHQLEPGAWLVLGGGVALVLGGMAAGRKKVVVVKQPITERPAVDRPIVQKPAVQKPIVPDAPVSRDGSRIRLRTRLYGGRSSGSGGGTSSADKRAADTSAVTVPPEANAAAEAEPDRAASKS